MRIPACIGPRVCELMKLTFLFFMSALSDLHAVTRACFRYVSPPEALGIWVACLFPMHRFRLDTVAHSGFGMVFAFHTHKQRYKPIYSSLVCASTIDEAFKRFFAPFAVSVAPARASEEANLRHANTGGTGKKKSQPHKGWDFTLWWRERRPTANQSQSPRSS